MIDQFSIRNLGRNKLVSWENLSSMNLLIGTNGTGKTSVLKMLYAVLKSLETYKQGREPRAFNDILALKLYWTFQVERLGELVTKGEKSSLAVNLILDQKKCEFEFGEGTQTKIVKYASDFTSSWDNSCIFIPAKEVLTLSKIILTTREQENLFGFDDTYLDLVRALEIPSKKGKNFQAFAEGRTRLSELLRGGVDFDEKTGQWYFWEGNKKFAITITSEGIKKLAIFNRLLANRYLRNSSIIFIDEPEASLHPKAISQFMEILYKLAQGGMQIFMATHSYFVIKKIYLLAKREGGSVPVLSFDGEDSPRYMNMQDGMPENSIIQESVDLYQDEVNMALGEI